MEHFTPLVSVVIPVFNGENYLREAIDSVLSQSYGNYEIIVVNDGSTDRTEDIALSYENKIRYFKKENGGQSSALNYGIERMQGEYFSWLSHDDKYYPKKLERSIQVIAGLKDKKSVIYTASTTIDESGIKIKSIFIENEGRISPTYFLLRYNSFNGNSLLIHADLLKKEGNFNLNRPHTSDVELFFNLSRYSNFYYINEELVYSRVHKNQATFRNYKYHIYESNIFLIDSLNKLTNNEIVKFSDFNKLEEVLTDLSINWSKRGYKYAYKIALFRLFNSTSLSFFEKLKLLVYCRFLYSKKIFLNYLKYLIS